MCVGYKTDGDTEARTKTTVTKRNEKMAENLRHETKDANTESWQRRYDRKLRKMFFLAPVAYLINGQRIQWLGHIIR